jgi:DNA end-binding protein Ku
MARPIWSGSISFGLVSVPVKLYSAVSPKTVRFHQLHKSDGGRVAQKRVCSVDGEEVAFQDIVKGYEIAPDRYIVIEPDELSSLSPAGTQTIDIEDFVQLSEIDPIYYDHSYYLVPAKGGAKPYQLLLDAMRDTEKIAVARVVLRSKQHLVAIRPIGDVLGMATMNFADEVVPADQLDEVANPEEVKVSKREREIAVQLVQSLAGAFEPSKYKDTYREAVLGLIERKAEGEEIATQPPAAPQQLKAPDLMSALQASLDQVRKHTASNDGRAPKRTRKKPSTTKTSAATKSKAKAPKPTASSARSRSK